MDAAHSDQQAGAAIAGLLDELERDAEEVALAAALRAIVDGARNPDLLADLDQTHTVMVTAILNQLHDSDTYQPGPGVQNEEEMIG